MRSNFITPLFAAAYFDEAQHAYVVLIIREVLLFRKNVRVAIDDFLKLGYTALEAVCFTICAKSGHSPSLKSYGELK